MAHKFFYKINHENEKILCDILDRLSKIDSISDSSHVLRICLLELDALLICQKFGGCLDEKD